MLLFWRTSGLFLFLLTKVHFSESQNRSNIRDVLKEIFITHDYNKNTLPTEDVSVPVKVDISLLFLGIGEIDEVQEKVVSTGILEITWYDADLAWDIEAHNHLENIFIPQNDIWKPDISLVNGFTKTNELGSSRSSVHVDSNGNVLWSPFEVFETRCHLYTMYYPFDQQSCDMIFVIDSFTAKDVEISSSLGYLTHEHFQEHGVWTLVELGFYVTNDEIESGIIFTITMRRKPLYHLVNILLPIVFLGFLTGLVFLIPAESGEKTGYSITVFLSLVVFLTIINKLLPVNSDEVSVIGVYILLQVFLGVIVLVASTLQLRLNFRCPSEPVSGIYFKLATCKGKGISSCMCRIKRSAKVEDVHSAEFSAKEEHDISLTWKNVAAALDVIYFRSFCIIYTLLTCMTFLILIIQPV